MEQLLILIGYHMIGLIVSPLFWCVVVLIGFQMRKIAKLKQQLFHVPQEKIIGKTIQGIGFGLLGGYIGSLLLVLLGISIDQIALEYLWIVAILLIFIHQRFMCFAYSGGLLAISCYLFGWPQMNIAQLIGLIAVLHLIEALLIVLSGHLQAIPIYTKSRNGTTIGGFHVQNFWPLPLVTLMVMIAPFPTMMSDMMAMPQWWPILPAQFTGQFQQNHLIYSMVPVLAALGYSDLALTCTARKKSYQSAWQLAVYSLMLLSLAIVSVWVNEVALLAAVFSIVGHECLIRYSQKKEMNGAYLFVAPQNGVMILEVLAHYPAKNGGLKCGDIIVGIDQHSINNYADFNQAMVSLSQTVHVDYIRNQKMKHCKLSRWEGESLGILLVPEPGHQHYLQYDKQTGLVSVLKRKFSKWKKR